MFGVATIENPLADALNAGSGHVIAWLLLGLLALVLLLGVAAFFLIQHWSRQRSGLAPKGSRQGRGRRSSDTRLLRPLVFEPPRRWLAVRGLDPQMVQLALGLHNAAPCSWEGGMRPAQDHRVFITPSVSGWMLAMGHGLPDPSEDVDECFRFLLELSRRVGEVQFFSVNRAVNHHSWVKAHYGRVVRAYAWAGKTIWNQGEMTPGEKALRVKCLDYGESYSAGLGTHDYSRSNAEKVLSLAARWSLDPTAVEASASHEAMGIAGDLHPSRTH